MAFNTKNMVLDGQKNQAPQYYNATTDSYEVIQGEGGALFYKLNGRTVESLIGNNVTVGAGASVVIQNFTDHTNIDELSVTAVTPNAAHSFELSVDGKDMAELTFSLAKNAVSGTRATIQRFKPDVVDLQVTIKNNDTVSHTYHVTKTVWNK